MLAAVLAEGAERLAQRKLVLPLPELEDECQHIPEPESLKGALCQPGLSLIAEFKRSSPSGSVINSRVSVAQQCQAYEHGGARAVSVLTCEPEFNGALEDLRIARESCSLPLLCKDFIVDRYQVLEAAVAGASAILLIARILTDAQLEELIQQAHDLGLECLIETRSESELERSLKLTGDIIGINNRDLSSGIVNQEHVFKLLPDVSSGATVVAESGYDSAAQLEELWHRGVDGVLIGEALMCSENPETATRQLLSRCQE